METLQSFLKDTSGPAPEMGQTGALTDWLPFCQLRIESGKACVCDPAFSPPQTEMEISVTLQPGEYLVEARGIAFGSDRRVAALRCVRAGQNNFEHGEILGEVGVDTGRIGLCDEEAFGAAAAEAGENLVIDLLDEIEDRAAILKLSSSAMFPFVDSGFGDGSYPVTELRAGGELAGFEISLVTEDEKYPFGGIGSDEGESSEDDAADAAFGFVNELLEKMREQRATGQAPDKESLKSLMEEMLNARAREIGELKECREHLIAQRKAAPPLRIVARPIEAGAVERAGFAEKRRLLEAAGYQLKNVYEFAQIPGVPLACFAHLENGTIATITFGAPITTELVAEYADGKSFRVRDTEPKPGLTPPPWITYRYEPGKSVSDLAAIFEAHRPAEPIKISPEQIKTAVEEDFHRVQSWRLNRGGWNRDEIHQQLGLENPDPDQIEEACLNVLEKWLFAWLKENHPGRAEELLEKLVIVHDEHDAGWLQVLWLTAGGSAKVRRASFEGDCPREQFRRVNEANGQPLQIIAQKTSGFGADYYAPPTG